MGMATLEPESFGFEHATRVKLKTNITKRIIDSLLFINNSFVSMPNYSRLSKFYSSATKPPRKYP